MRWVSDEKSCHSGVLRLEEKEGKGEEGGGGLNRLGAAMNRAGINGIKEGSNRRGGSVSGGDFGQRRETTDRWDPVSARVGGNGTYRFGIPRSGPWAKTNAGPDGFPVLFIYFSSLFFFSFYVFFIYS
jgi:hypothetical protein